MKPEPSIDSLDESMNDVPGLFLEEPNLRLMRFEWSGEILHASPTTLSPSLIEGIQEFRYRHIRMQSLVYPTHSFAWRLAFLRRISALQSESTISSAYNKDLSE